MGIGKYQHFSITRISRRVIYIYMCVQRIGVRYTQQHPACRRRDCITETQNKFHPFFVLFSPTCKNNTPRAFESSCTARRRIITPERTSMICYT